MYTYVHMCMFMHIYVLRMQSRSTCTAAEHVTHHILITWAQIFSTCLSNALALSIWLSVFNCAAMAVFISSLTVNGLSEYLITEDFSKEIPRAFQENGINGSIFCELSDSHLHEITSEIDNRVKLKKKICRTVLAVKGQQLKLARYVLPVILSHSAFKYLSQCF